MTLKEEILACHRCDGVDSDRKVIGTVAGDPKSLEVVFVGESPGKNEMVTQRPFSGPSGVLLRSILERCKIENFAFLNVLKCGNTEGRAPNIPEISACIPS